MRNKARKKLIRRWIGDLLIKAICVAVTVVSGYWVGYYFVTMLIQRPEYVLSLVIFLIVLTPLVWLLVKLIEKKF